jgi:hypothetical protein
VSKITCQLRSDVHAYAVHRAPVHPLEAGHVHVGEVVALVGTRAYGGRESGSGGRGGGRGVPAGRRRADTGAHRGDGIRRVPVARQRRVRSEQLAVTGDGRRLCLRGGDGGRLNVRLGLHHGQRVGGGGYRAGRRSGHPHAQTAEHETFAEQLGARLHRFLGLGLLALDLLVLDGVEVDLADAVHHVLVLESDEPETAVSLRLLIHQHHGLLHLAELTEVGFHLVGRSVLADAADEDLFRFVRLFRSVLGRGVFRVDLLAVQRVDGHFEHVVHARGFRERDKTEAPTPLQKNQNMSTLRRDEPELVVPV